MSDDEDRKEPLNSDSKDEFLESKNIIKQQMESEKATAGGGKDEEDEEEERNLKTYLRLILPHVGLVLASILYAVSGAFIFYSVEMRHEIETKSQSVRKVTLARYDLVDTMWNNSRLHRMSKDSWSREAERQFANWTSVLYVAFKKEFVKFSHVSSSRTFRLATDGGGDGYNLTFAQDDHNVWTPSSSIFFAWTTMATIGYGNIVPVTMGGRIICVFFALFGTPLAILTIGDLGKFLSESTIAGYKKYQKYRDIVRARLCPRSTSAAADRANARHEKRSYDSEFSFEDLVLHKAQVPVVVVFAILLIYIALGGLLFSVLEGWKYVDAFYFCFISLTTVGFGDMVPRRHTYLVIMLLYIGVGLAVTTMCIDLVGIHYLQKIHYFGRKFKGYDLLRLLRQRRMIERRMAMAAQAADIMQMYFEAVEGSNPPSPLVPKYLMERELPIHEPLIASPTTDKLVSPDWPIDNVYEQPLHEVSPISTTPSYYERVQFWDGNEKRMAAAPVLSPSIRSSLLGSSPTSAHERTQPTRPDPKSHRPVHFRMYQRLQQKSGAASWTPSGPDISIECSIPTSPSLYEREQMYATMHERSWPQSPDTFYTFPLPSPDYEKIAQEVRSAKRSGSCPGRYILRAVSPQTPTPLGMSLMEEWDSYRELLDRSRRPRLSIPNINVEQPSIREEDSDEEVYPPSLLSPLEFATPPSSSTTYSQPSSPGGDSVVEFPVRVGARFRDLGTYPTQTDSGRASATASDANGGEENSMLFHQNLPIYAVESHTVGSEHALQASFNCPTEFISHAPPTMVTDNYCFVVDGHAVEVEKDLNNIDIEWWKPTSHPTHYYYSDDYKTFKRVHIVTVRGRIVGARMRGVLKKQPTPSPPPPPPPGVEASGGASSSTTAVVAPATLHHPPPPAPPVVIHKNVPLANVFRVSRYYSYWKTCAHFHRIITVISPVKESAQPKFKKRVFFQFLWHRDAKESDKLRVAMEYAPVRQAEMLKPRGSSFSAAGAVSSLPATTTGSAGGSNPPSGSVSPKNYLQRPDEAGTSGGAGRRPSMPASTFNKRMRSSSVYQL